MLTKSFFFCIIPLELWAFIYTPRRFGDTAGLVISRLLSFNCIYCTQKDFFLDIEKPYHVRRANM